MYGPDQIGTSRISRFGMGCDGHKWSIKTAYAIIGNEMAIISNKQGQDQEVSLLPATLDFRLYKGDSIDLNFILKDSAGTPVNLDGFIGTVEFKDSSNNIVATPTI